MESTVSVGPSVCFEVQKILSVSGANGNMRTYQVQWAPTWVSGFHLMGCEHLIEEFVQQQQQSEKNQFVDETTLVTDANESLTSLRADVSRNDVPVPSKQNYVEDINTRVSMVVNDVHCFQNHSSESYLCPTSSNGNVEGIMSMTSGEICTGDMCGSSRTNPDVWVKIEELQSNEDADDEALPLSLVYDDSHTNNDLRTANTIVVEDDAELLAHHHDEAHQPECSKEFQQPECSIEFHQPECSNELEDNIVVVKSEEITLGEMSATDQTRINFENKLRELRELTRFHSSDKRLECMECNKIFKTRGNLNAHLRLHRGVKPYTCSTCPKSFSKKDTLTKHIRLHTGERPYSCTQCTKSFTQKISLTKHTRVHTQERPYKCAVCGKTYTENGSLKWHSRIHQGGEKNVTVATY